MEILIQPIKAFLREQKVLDKAEKVAAVLCTSYDIEEYLDNEIDCCLLEFDDTETAAKAGAFNSELAKKIRLFVDTLDDQTILYVCCDAGCSRSSAVAAAIYRYKSIDDSHIWKDSEYCPNMLVYRTLLEEFDVYLTDDELEKRRSRLV